MKSEVLHSSHEQANFAVEAPRWLLLILLVYAPLAYGCTDAESIHRLEIGIGVVLGLWLVSSVAFRRLPRVHPVCAGCLALILLQGWWMTFNAHFRYSDESALFLSQASPVSWLPGAVDRATAGAMMIRLTCLAGVTCFVSDLAARSEWRNRIWWTVGLTGGAFVLLALLQRVTDAPSIFWGNVPTTSSSFGTFIYHGNAGSFINLVLPWIAGLAVIAITEPAAHGARALWLSSLFLCVAGAFVNVSRAGAAVTGLLLGIFLFFEGRRLADRVWLPEARVLLTYVGAVIVFLGGLVMFAGWESPSQKWALLQSQLNSENPRLLALQACWRMIADAGIWGLGPGTFAIAFPHYTQFLGDSIAGTWRYAHQDYAQMVIEWGWVGTLAPALLFLGGIHRCFAVPRRGDRKLPENDRLLSFCIGLALVGVALHALVDFPLQITSLQFYVAVYLGLAWGPDWLGGIDDGG